VAEAIHSYGLVVLGDSLICTIPCGFGVEEGNYVFTVSASGYPPQLRGYEARYNEVKGGCPGYSDKGERVTLRLRAE
jgi:hypothetical protein